MAPKIFISTSGGQNEWTHEFKLAIARHCQLELDDVYWYYGEYGHEVEPEIRRNAESALILLCLVTDGFATSPWCLQEHRWFFKGKAESKFAIPVWAYGLTDWPDFKDTNAKKQFKSVKRKKIVEPIRKQFPADESFLTQYADRWLDWLMNVAGADLRSFPNIRAASNVKTAKTSNVQLLLRRLAADIDAARRAREDEERDPERKALRSAAYLSAYALAADRYWDGGWGFSTAEEFSFDEDGDELARGRYDLNVVILRALEVFLDSKTVRDEWEFALGAGNRARPLRLVKDRLPSVARFLACLEGGSAFQQVLLIESAEIAAELNADPPNKRWGLDLLGADDRSSEHHLVLLEFVFRSLDLAQSDEFFCQALVRYGVKLEDANDKVNKLELLVSEWLSDNNIFLDLARGTASPDSRKSRILRAILWCLLSGSAGGRDLIARELSARMRQSEEWDIRSFERFETSVASAVRAAIEDPASAGDTLLLTVVCAFVLHSMAQDSDRQLLFKTQFDKLLVLIVEALSSPAAGTLLLRMNSLGWAAIVLLANDVLKESPDELGIDQTFLAAMWDMGRQLRRIRVHALSQGTVFDLKDGGLQDVVDAEIGRVIGGDVATRLVVADDESEQLRRAERLKEDIKSSTFWGRSRPQSRTPHDICHCLAGVLQVWSPSGRIDIENEGYNRLFLYPFSELTDMKVFDLMSVRRELGEQDTTLVEKMGAVVVEECFARVGDKFVSTGDNGFKLRTDFITEQLKDRNWPNHLGFDDLLKLRAGKNGFRWVYRTALIQPEHGGRSATGGREHMIAWHFVEVPASAEALTERHASMADVGSPADGPPMRSSTTG